MEAEFTHGYGQIIRTDGKPNLSLHGVAYTDHPGEEVGFRITGREELELLICSAADALAAAPVPARLRRNCRANAEVLRRLADYLEQQDDREGYAREFAQGRKPAPPLTSRYDAQSFSWIGGRSDGRAKYEEVRPLWLAGHVQKHLTTGRGRNRKMPQMGVCRAAVDKALADLGGIDADHADVIMSAIAIIKTDGSAP